MNALTPINDKVVSLIPRLGSDKDGEVVATARAITRQLAKTGADWHTITAMLTASAFDTEPDGVTTYAEALDWIIANGDGCLSAKEAHFIANMQHNLRRWDCPTPKQAKWIGDILHRLGGSWA